ncbi:MAG: leucine-rich repeat domain-containing protein [Clostridia bacterium]|nr:leucine-rich repeat domain-containing protein [Clostridia bacterium]
MKKKILLTLLIVSLLACTFAITVGATVPEWTETKSLDGFSAKTTTDGTVTFDTTSRVMLSHTVTDPDTQEETTVYTTYPAYYILKCTDTIFSSKRTELDFTAINEATNITYSYASILKLEIPVGFTSMEDRNFRDDQGIDCIIYVKIPDTVTSIGDCPFYNNSTVEEVEIPDSVTSMNTNIAFLGATKLTTLKFSRGISVIDSQCFYQCSSLTTVTGFEGVTSVKSQAFNGCSSLSAITLNDNVTEIGETAFYNCNALQSINLGNVLTSIGKSAFKNCTSFTSITIPASVSSVGTTAFYGCTSLESVDYRGSIIGTYMFDACSGLKSVKTTKSLVEIGERAFRNCSALTSFNFCEGLTTIGNYAFYKAGFVSLDLPSTLTTVGDSVFESCSSITSVRLRGSVVGATMFKYCSKLATVSIPMLTSVGKEAFYSTYLKQNGQNTAGGVIFFAGNDYETLIATGTINSGNAYFSSAILCTYEEYLAYKEDGTVPEGKTFSGKNLLVYGCKPCDVLYDGHAFSDTDTPVFTGDSFISTCNVGTLCTRNGCGEGVIKSTLDPLFSFAGFSKSDYNGAIMQSFAIDRSLVDEYTTLFGDISFGLIGAVEDVDPSDEVAGQFGGVLYDSESNTFKNKVASIDFSKNSYDIFELIITGLNDYANAQIYCCGYILVNGQLYYLHNGTVSSTPTAITYSSIS